MCEYCAQIEQVPYIDTPRKYEKIIAYIKDLVENHGFLLVEGTCPLGAHKKENGCWADDEITHIIRCPKCGQTFELYVNTYRGGGSFTENE